MVAIIGNRRPPPGATEVAETLGRLIVEQGWRLVTGGLGGVMEAASRGAHTAACYREGDVVGILPNADPSTANPYVDIAIPTNLGIARNVLVVSMADAVIAVAGGAGTLSEIALAWQLGRVVVGLEVGGWSERVAGHSLDDKRPDVVIAAPSAQAAVDALKAAL